MASKRKAEFAVAGISNNNGEALDTDSDASDYAPSAIDVSFNYVAPAPIDFAALKRLTQQLFHTHSPDLNLTALVDEILTWGDQSVGTVVKVEDDEDGDPFAFASVINLASASSSSTTEAVSSSKNEGGKALLEYYQKALRSGASSSSSSKAAAQSIQSILAKPETKPLQIFHERMINLPPQIMPPLYKMLFEEIKANEELNASTHFLFFSRVFSTAAFDDDDDDDANGEDSQMSKSGSGRSGKKQKKSIPRNNAIAKMSTNGEAGGEKEMGLFHPEDVILAKHALSSFTYRFPPTKDSDESFNAPMYARLVLIKRDEQTINVLLKELEEAFAVPL